MHRAIRLILAFAVCVLAAAQSFSAQDAISLFRDGSAAQAGGDYYAAIERYKASLTANPSYLSPMTGLAECFFLLEDYDEAMRWVSKAKSYSRADEDLSILEGRIKIGQGDLKAARAIFQDVLSRQPNNLEARFGMAEADVAEGRVKEALSQYAQGLKLAPESRKALLSIAMLSDETGDQASAARYFDLVVRSHSDDPQVELEAAAWYARKGDLETAEKRAKIAISLKPDLDDAQLLLGSIYLESGRLADASDALRQVVTRNRDNTLAWYGLGIAYARSSDAAKAMSSLATVLSIRPEDEVARIAEESVALASLKMEDPQRQKLAAYHVTLGGELESRDFLDRAIVEYRRALLLDPISRDARVDYARILRIQGFPAKYLSELEVLAKLGIKDTFVNDEIESYTSALSDSLSRTWGVDQFALDRRKYAIPVFTVSTTNRLIHTQSSELLARYFTDMLLRYESIQIPDIPPSVSAIEEAFRAAREKGCEYFLLLSMEDSERSFSAAADLYLGSTGARVASFAAYRTGNDRIRDSFLKIGSQLASALPARGTLIQRKFDQGLVDLGSFQGIKKGDVMAVVRKGRVVLASDSPAIQYNEADVVGTFTIQATDEGIAVGTLERQGYFDFINTSDEVVYPMPQKPQAPPQTAPKKGNILTRLFGVQG
jgi:tetratricopeptide (TPR) repeat protein